MTKTLQEQIEARKEEAGRKDIFGKGRNVGIELGSYDLNGSRRSYDGDWEKLRTYTSTVSSLKVSCLTWHTAAFGSDGYDDDGDYVTITYGGKTVFEGRGYSAYGVEAYVPGDWEKELDKLAKQAEAIIQKRRDDAIRAEAQRKAAAEAAERAKWGLDSKETEQPKKETKASISEAFSRGLKEPLPIPPPLVVKRRPTFRRS